MFEAAKKEAAGYHRDLLEIRKRILDLSQKFDRGEPQKGKKRSKRKEEEQWKGSEDVEKLSAIFTAYLTSPSNFTKIEAGQQSPQTVTNAQRAATDGAAAQAE